MFNFYEYIITAGLEKAQLNQITNIILVWMAHIARTQKPLDKSEEVKVNLNNVKRRSASGHIMWWWGSSGNDIRLYSWGSKNHWVWWNLKLLEVENTPWKKDLHSPEYFIQKQRQYYFTGLQRSSNQGYVFQYRYMDARELGWRKGWSWKVWYFELVWRLWESLSDPTVIGFGVVYKLSGRTVQSWNSCFNTSWKKLWLMEKTRSGKLKATKRRGDRDGMSG